MKTIKLLSIFLTLSFLVSCSKDEPSTPEEQLEKTASMEVSKQVISKVADLHFNSKMVEKHKMLLPDGSYTDNYLIEDDIVMSKEQLFTMSSASITNKQYRTYNLVSSPRTINVIGYTGGSQALTSKQRTALQYALGNYNALNTEYPLL